MKDSASVFDELEFEVDIKWCDFKKRQDLH